MLALPNDFNKVRSIFGWGAPLVLYAMFGCFCGTNSAGADAGTDGATPEDAVAEDAVTDASMPLACSSDAGSGGVASTILTVLQNIHTDGFDSLSTLNGGLGGLWVDWKYGTVPLLTNGGKCTVTSGMPPDCGDAGPPGHDPLTDLRYLHNLYLYKALNSTDTQFDADVSLYTKIVKAEFVGYGGDKEPFVYDELSDLYALSKDSWYDAQRKQMVSGWFTSDFHPSIGTVYFVTAQAPQGLYSTMRALEIAAGLIEGGSTYGRTDWIAAGQSTIDFIYSHGFDAQLHLFPRLLGNVLNADGTANPCEVFVDSTEPSGEVVHGASVHASENGRVAVSFLRAYLAMSSPDPKLLARAEELLDGLTIASNTAGLWDTTYGGYFRIRNLSGSGYCNFGSLGQTANTKECGRQQVLLEAYHLADSIPSTADRYCSMEQAMTTIALGPAYFPNGHGYVYQRQQDWTPVNLPGADYVTTESMGIALEALQNLTAAHPW